MCLRLPQPLLAACWLVLVLLSTGAVAGETRIEVIPLQNRPAEELIPILSPMIAQDGALTGTGFQLIVRTTPENLAQIKELVAALDKAPRRLLITVKQDADTDRSGAGAEASGRIGVGEGQIVISTDDKTPQDEGVEARIYSSRSRDRDANTQSIQTLEGKPAYIAIGRSVPVSQESVIYGPAGPTVYQGIQYRDVTVGFDALPQVSGDRVTLEIHPHRDTLSPEGGGQINIQSISTTVSGRLGEWMDIGGVVDEQLQHATGTVYATRRQADERRRVLIKVEELP